MLFRSVADIERDIRVVETISKPGSATVVSTVGDGLAGGGAGEGIWSVDRGIPTVKVAAKVTTTAAAFTVVPGSVLPAGGTFGYSWYVADELVGTSASLPRDPAYAGKMVNVHITYDVNGYYENNQDLFPQLAPAPVKATPFPITDPRVGEEARWVFDGLDFPAGSQWSIRATYQWFSGTVAIKGATAPVFTPTAAQAGKPLHVKTTFSSKGFATKVYTSQAKVVALGAPAELGITVSEEGTEAGSTVSSVVLSPRPGYAVSYQWFRMNNDEVSTAIPKATKSSYATAPADAGTVVQLRVTYTRAGYASATHFAGATWVYGRDGLVDTVAPSITGSGAVGSPLTVKAGTWLNAPTLTYQWLRNGVNIPGATSVTYTPQGDHLGDTISVEVMAKRVGFDTRWVTTNEIKVTVGAAPRNPTNGEPKITGTPATCSTLSVSTGTWNLDGLAFSYQWMRSSALGGGPIAGATSSTYVSSSDDQGYKLYVMVTATRDGYAEGSNKTALTAAFTAGAGCPQN